MRMQYHIRAMILQTVSRVRSCVVEKACHTVEEGGCGPSQLGRNCRHRSEQAMIHRQSVVQERANDLLAVSDLHGVEWGRHIEQVIGDGAHTENGSGCVTLQGGRAGDAVRARRRGGCSR